MQKIRFVSLDLFRGLTVFLMFLVNLPGSFDHVYPLLEHAPWHGLTPADCVFPWFLVCAGAALPMAMNDQRRRGVSTQSIVQHILLRGVQLFIFGVFLGWILRPGFSLPDIRIAGVLQRIALVYMFTALIYCAIGTRPVVALLIAVASLIIGWALLTHLPVPGYGAANLEKGSNYFAWLDQNYLPGRLFKKAWDPEGIGGTLTATASACLGLAVSLVLQRLPQERHPRVLMAIAALLLVSGMIWAQKLPLNKNLWTSSYVLVTAGLGCALWAATAAVKSTQSLLWSWVCVLGQTALTAYTVHWLLIRVLITKIHGVRLGEHVFAPVAGLLPDPQAASLLLALVYVGLSVAPMKYLKRRGWLIRF